MLQALLTTLFVILCFVMIFTILLQRGKGGAGLLSNMGTANAKLFGGTGGQDFFQKATWVMGFLMMAGSLGLALMKRTDYDSGLLDRQVPVEIVEEEATQD